MIHFWYAFECYFCGSQGPKVLGQPSSDNPVKTAPHQYAGWKLTPKGNHLCEFCKNGNHHLSDGERKLRGMKTRK